MAINSVLSHCSLRSLALALFVPAVLSARIPEHPAQVEIPRIASNATTIFRGWVSNVIPGETNVCGTKGAIAQVAVDRWYRGTGAAVVDVPFSYSRCMIGHDCINFQLGSYWIVFVTADGHMVDDCEGALTVSPRLALETPGANDWLSLMLADFAAGLQDSNSEERIISIQRLGNLQSRQTLPFLQPALKIKDGEEYEWAVYAALRAGDISVLPAVKELLQKYPLAHIPEGFMEREIMDITDKAAVPDLLAILRGAAEGHFAAIIALGHMGDRRVLSDIAPYLADSDRYVRYQAMSAIRTLLPSSGCDITPSASEEELDSEEQKCLAWWQQVGSEIVH